MAMRVMIKKSVADEICRWWGLPLVRKSNPCHDERGRFAAGGGGAFAEAVPFTDEIKDEVTERIKNTTAKMRVVEYSRENYDRLFPEGEVKTPIGKVRMSRHQFERIGAKDNGKRKVLLGAIHQTLSEPDVIIKDLDSQGREAKLYIKSFLGGKTGKKIVFSVIPNINGIHVSVSNGLRKLKNAEDKIKRASIFYYKAEGGGSTTGTAGNPDVAQQEKSIAQAAKNASEKSLHPRRCRLMVRKGVARQILLKANPHHDAQGRFASCGEGAPQKNLCEYIEAILGGTSEQRAALERTYFQMARTPQKLKDIGLVGDAFTVRYGVISRHKDKDTAHNLTADEWKTLCRRLESADNLVVAKHGEGFSVFLALPDTTMVGVTVKNAGKNLEVNSVSTVYKREIKEAEEIVYPKEGKMSPEQSALLDRQKLSISASSDIKPDTIIPQGKRNASDKSTHPRLVVQKAVADEICRWWGLPLVCKANPHHDARGRFASVQERKSPYDGVDMDRLRSAFNEKTNRYIGKRITNKATGRAVVFTKASQKAVRSHTKNSVEVNGFTPYEHFEVANQVVELFQNATLENEHEDTKHGKPDLRIERFLSQPVTLKSGREVQACITVKHSLNPDGRRIYAIEAMEIKEALEKTRAKGRQPNKSGDTSRDQNVSHSTKKSSRFPRFMIRKSVARQILRQEHRWAECGGSYPLAGCAQLYRKSGGFKQTGGSNG